MGAIHGKLPNISEWIGKNGFYSWFFQVKYAAKIPYP